MRRMLGGRKRLRAVVAHALAATPCAAQALPLRCYDVAEGLANSRVNHVLQDRAGYLWIATWEGLSRFDGTSFRNYDAQPIGAAYVAALEEDRDGNLWLATAGGGVTRLDDRRANANRSASFETFTLPSMPADAPSSATAKDAAEQVYSLLCDRGNRLWCGSSAGLWRAQLASDGAPRFERVVEGCRIEWPQLAARASLSATSERLWFGSDGEVLEFESGSGGDELVRHSNPDAPGLGEMIALAPIDAGRVLVAFDHALYELGAGAQGAWERVPIELQPQEFVRALLRDSRGEVWLATRRGLVHWNGRETERFDTARGLPDDSLRALCEDRDGNLWIGTWSAGLCRLSSRGIVSWTSASGLPERDAVRLVDLGGEGLLVTQNRALVLLDGSTVRRLPGLDDAQLGSIGMRILRDSRRDWWIGTDTGLLFAPGPALDLSRATKIEVPNWAAHGVFGAPYEDARGELWLSDDAGVLAHAALASSAPGVAPPLETMSLGIEPPGSSATREFLRLSNGDLWLAPYDGLVRLRGGVARPIEIDREVQPVRPRCLFLDHLGGLWIGTRFRGVWHSSDPQAETPRFTQLSSADGLSSDAVWSIAEDRAGRLYFGTARGLERFDPRTRAIRHITPLDGLAGEIVNHCLADAHGRIWVATSGGVSRIEPESEDPPPAPATVRITAVRVAGEDLPAAERGVTELDLGTLSATQNSIELRFEAPSFRGERELAFQYRLEGGDEPWSRPTQQRSVTLARLAPGDYDLRLRAVQPAATTPPALARVSFRIAPPWWQRAWFLASCALLLALGAWSLHRARVRRLLALEAVRQQIAADIHDDMGAGLAQIAILTEVVKRDSTPSSRPQLDEVARLARALRESMSDLVWAIDPRKDTLAELVQRLRQIATNLFESENTRVELRLPDETQLAHVELPTNLRRHLLLVLKEALSNTARHARAECVRIELTLTPTHLHVTLADDGRGFDTSASSSGHGLTTLRHRATALAANLELDSTSTGTTLHLEIPL